MAESMEAGRHRPGFEETVRALEEEGASLDRLLAELSAERWRWPTRLAEWDVTILVAHLARTLQLLTTYAETPFAGPVETYDPSRSGAQVNARAREAAVGQTPASLRQALAGAVASAAATARRLGPEAIIQTRFGPQPVRTYLESRVVEACIHGLDLRDAAGAPMVPTALALRVTAGQLATRLGEPRPPDLGDDLAFVEAAAGRRPYAHPRFPLV